MLSSLHYDLSQVRVNVEISLLLTHSSQSRYWVVYMFGSGLHCAPLPYSGKDWLLSLEICKSAIFYGDVLVMFCAECAIALFGYGTSI